MVMFIGENGCITHIHGYKLLNINESVKHGIKYYAKVNTKTSWYKQSGNNSSNSICEWI